MHECLRQSGGFARKLTLDFAPDGFGKTTLISAWVAGSQSLKRKVGVAWLSMVEGDKDLTSFLAYLVVTLQTVSPNIGEDALAALQSSQQLPTESILTALVHEITALPDDLILILDDYHEIDAKPVDNALTFLLEHRRHKCTWSWGTTPGIPIRPFCLA